MLVSNLIPRYIVYYRVSTKRQGRSGLGLEAQKVDVDKEVAFNQGVVLAVYTEIETRKDAQRPELKKALAHARLCKATLIVAKLDRLAGNVAFVSSLMEAGVDFICCDCKHATRFTLHILAAVAEDEVCKISERTTKALAALKAKGVKLGSARPGHWDGREHLRGYKKATIASARVRQEVTREKYAFIVSLITDMRSQGKTLGEIVGWLNANNHCTTAGKPFDASKVSRLFTRYAPEMSKSTRLSARNLVLEDIECFEKNGLSR
jgi:DNA invertase Pin-like site-specific DNA recombinase